MKILMLPSFYGTPSKPREGIFFREQAVALDRSGFSVEVLFLEQRSIREFRLKALKESHYQMTVTEGHPRTVRIHGWNTLCQTTLGAKLWVAISYDYVLRWIRTNGMPDILHAQNCLWAGCIARRVKESLGIPYVVTEHSSGFLKGEWLSSERQAIVETMTAAKYVVSVSHALARKIKEVYAGASIAVVPNTVDTDYFSLPKKSRSTDRFIFSCIGRLDQNKAFELVIYAFVRAFEHDSTVFLFLAGDGPRKVELQTLILKLGVSDRVKLLGPKNREETRELLWTSNALVSCSYVETFGVTLIEAMSTGIPIIATSSGGPADIVGDSVGTLVPVGDVEALAEAMRVMKHTIEYSSVDIRKFVVDTYGHQTFADRMRELFR